MSPEFYPVSTRGYTPKQRREAVSRRIQRTETQTAELLKREQQMSEAAERAGDDSPLGPLADMMKTVMSPMTSSLLPGGDADPRDQEKRNQEAEIYSRARLYIDRRNPEVPVLWDFMEAIDNAVSASIQTESPVAVVIQKRFGKLLLNGPVAEAFIAYLQFHGSLNIEDERQPCPDCKELSLKERIANPPCDNCGGLRWLPKTSTAVEDIPLGRP